MTYELELFLLKSFFLYFIKNFVSCFFKRVSHFFILTFLKESWLFIYYVKNNGN